VWGRAPCGALPPRQREQRQVSQNSRLRLVERPLPDLAAALHVVEHPSDLILQRQAGRSRLATRLRDKGGSTTEIARAVMVLMRAGKCGEATPRGSRSMAQGARARCHRQRQVELHMDVDARWPADAPGIVCGKRQLIIGMNACVGMAVVSRQRVPIHEPHERGGSGPFHEEVMLIGADRKIEMTPAMQARMAGG